MPLAQLVWMDRKGAGRMMQGEARVLCERLATLRAKGTVKLLNGKVIGESYRATGEVDDKRVKWLWWFDSAECA